MALTKEEQTLQRHDRIMTEIFESFEWLLKRDFETVDSRLVKLSKEASACNVPAEFRERFVREKLIVMFEQIAEKR